MGEASFCRMTLSHQFSERRSVPSVQDPSQWLSGLEALGWPHGRSLRELSRQPLDDLLMPRVELQKLYPGLQLKVGKIKTRGDDTPTIA